MKFSTLLPVLLGVFFASIFASCQKDSGKQPEDLTPLRQQIAALEQRTDSLAHALAITNSHVDSISKKIDSLRIQLTAVMDSITVLNTKLGSVNADLNNIKTKLTDLTQQYQDLVGKLNEILALMNEAATSINDGLLAYFPFDGIVYDVSGNGNAGTIQGATLTSDKAGMPNSAYSFGPGKTIIIDHPTTSLNLTASFSISLWFKADALATNFNAAMLVSRHASDIGNDGWDIGIWNPNGNTTTQIVNFQANDQFNTNTYPPASGIVKTDTWYNFIVTYDKSNSQLAYYLNGEQILSKNLIFNMISNLKPITIGYQQDSGGGETDPFTGTIDEIRIYGRVLNGDEIAYLAH